MASAQQPLKTSEDTVETPMDTASPSTSGKNTAAKQQHRGRKPRGRKQQQSKTQDSGFTPSVRGKMIEIETARKTFTHELPISLFGVLLFTIRFIRHSRATATGALKTFYQHDPIRKSLAIVRSVWLAASIRREYCHNMAPGVGRVTQVYPEQDVRRVTQMMQRLPKPLIVCLQQIGQFQVAGSLVVPGLLGFGNEWDPFLNMDMYSVLRFCRALHEQAATNAVPQVPDANVASLLEFARSVFEGLTPAHGDVWAPGDDIMIPQELRRQRCYVAEDFTLLTEWAESFDDRAVELFNLCDVRGNISQMVRFSDFESEATCHVAVPVQYESLLLAGAVPTGLDFNFVARTDYLQYNGLNMAERHVLDRESCITRLLRK